MNHALLASLLPAAAAPAPARAGNAQHDDAAAGPGEFADCMEQARGTVAAQPKRGDGADDATEVDATAAVATAPADAAAPTTAPDLAALLPGWVPPPLVATPTATAPAPAADAVQGAALPALATEAGAGASARATAARDAPASAGTTAAAPSAEAAAASTAAAPAATGSLQQPDEARAAAADAALAATAPLPPAAAPTLSASVPRAAEAAAPFSAHLAAALDTPAFAPALATQVRWWAQDGVQQAQLTLHPPEMGPVAVTIVVFDGREARIDFTADLAATRSALESALPVLAAALDESGLKLSGGGVHDGAAQRQAPWQAPGTPAQGGRGGPSPGDGEHDVTGTPAPRRAGRGRGLVDLVA